MAEPIPDAEAAPTRREVADYLRDLCAQLAGVAHGGGLRDVARALGHARDLCDAALEDRLR